MLATDVHNMKVDDRDAVLHTFMAFRPELVLHGGALTAVDLCETEVDLAYAVNGVGTRNVAEAAALVGAHVVYVSTDYVFDGTSPRPYREWDQPNPASVYGASKLAGERECRPGSTIVRTSWVSGAHGANMVATALRLAGGDGELRFVDDQHGSPTFTADLAPAIVTLGLDRRPGIFHVTNSGSTTWWGFVRAVLEEVGADPDRVKPIATADLDPPIRAPRARPTPCSTTWRSASADCPPCRTGATAWPAWCPSCSRRRGPRHDGPAAAIRGRLRSSGPATSVCPRRRRSPTSATPWCWPSGTRPRLAALRSGRMPIVEAGLDELVADSVTRAGSGLHRLGRRGRRRRRLRLSLRPHAPARRWFGRRLLRGVGGQGDRHRT